MKLQSSLTLFGSSAALALLFVLPDIASAASVTYTGTSANGKWNTASNWSPAAVPVAGDDVLVVQSGNRNIVIDLNASYEAPGLNSLLLNGEGSGNVTVNSSKTFTVSGTSTIGSFGKGSFNQNKGTHSLGALVLGASEETDLGTYTLKKGNLSVLSDLTVGAAGQGVFTHRKGTVTVGNDLILGSDGTAVGNYTLSRGTLAVQGVTNIGVLGEATFNQNRGTSTHTSLQLGGDLAGQGRVNLSGGTLRSDTTIVGVGGFGQFYQSGGTHVVASDLVLGSTVTGFGEYALSQGNLEVGGKLFIGENGSGQVFQTGGKVTVTAGVVVNAGDYFISDASLVTGGLTVGDDGGLVVSGSTSRIRTTDDVIFGASSTILTTEAELVIAKGSDVNLSVLQEDIGRDATGFDENYAFRAITLESNITLSLSGVAGDSALYVDAFDIGLNNIFRLDSIIIGNGINIYYNADNEDNAYLAGLSYNLGNGGRLIGISEEESASAFGTLSESSFSSPTVGAVPEPSTWGLVVLGLVALLFRRRFSVLR